MKRLIWLTVMTAMLFGCSIAGPEDVFVYEAESFMEPKGPLVLSSNEQEEVVVFWEALKKSKKQPGIVSVAEPDYYVDFGTRHYFLWLSEEGGSASIMKEDDSHHLYTVAEESVLKMKAVLFGS